MATQNSTQQKPIHSLILDTGPLIKNTVSISTIINSAEELYTTPAILSEIRDEATRSRVQTTLVPFLKIRNPRPASYDAVIAFSKKTGDHSVLSRQDLGILALAYEIHCEKNGGSYGLREAPQQALKRRPGEKSTEEEESVATEVEENETPAEDEGWSQPKGKRAVKAKNIKIKKTAPFLDSDPEEVKAEQTSEGVPAIAKSEDEEVEQAEEQGGVAVPQEHIIELEPPAEATIKDDNNENGPLHSPTHDSIQGLDTQTPESTPAQKNLEVTSTSASVKSNPSAAPEDLEQRIDNLDISSSPQPTQQPTPPTTDSSDSDSDGDGEWITPSNISAHQAKDSGEQTSTRTAATQQLTVATMTIDFAMQSVLLQMNLALLSTNMQRIKHLTSKVLRCHACFAIVKQMDKQFCPRCGQSTLQRVSCSTNAKGEFRIHLARNYTWNKRGDKYSVPKPVAGTANGKWSGVGGGKGGWGRDLVLAEDQKEFVRANEEEKRRKTRDLMDEDYLPGLLTGDRGRAGGRMKVGAGKNVNAKRRT
ncbi:hypothetical protein IQ07DRAFT_586668 [Pyrenochaeta sp. DS3sAY3a]|nr:hypothetical protein IQ07DRAFT_586668 [Pyrenochaeta sp. DS3sAY3a]